MIKFLVVLALWSAVAQSAVLRNESTLLKRIERSFGEPCDDGQLPPPPPPPGQPVFIQGSHASAGASAGTFTHYNQGYNGQSGYSGRSGFGQGYNNGLSPSARGSLSGALNLPSQGLQGPHGGCTTCGGSSNSISNARSYSGNAVAVSVSG